ncbi:MAG: hypothetical protein WBN65_16160 [Gammaproteobacteria bacterium]
MQKVDGRVVDTDDFERYALLWTRCSLHGDRADFRDLGRTDPEQEIIKSRRANPAGGFFV